MLCTLAEVKARLAIVNDTANDTVLTGIILGVSARLAAEAGRIHRGAPCLEKGPVIAMLSPEPNRRSMPVPAMPIVSISEVKEALYGDFTSATALTVSTDYLINYELGSLTRIGIPWLPGDGTVRVTYIAGYTQCLTWVTGLTWVATDRCYYAGVIYVCILGLVSSTAPSSDATHWTATTETLMPADVTEAAIRQTVADFLARSSPGVASQSAQGASVSMSDSADDLLPSVRNTMANYRRYCG